MFNHLGYQLRVVWACAKKDFRAALTDRLFTVLSLFVPVNVLILMSLFVLAGSNAPTAVVMEDQGPYAQTFYKAMSQAYSFRLQIASSAEAERLITAGQIVAVVTIPADFDTQVQQNQPVQVGVQINNLNTDFTNDIRRAIPLSITSFYAKAFPNLVPVSIQEHDLYAHDTGYIPYLGVSILVIALMMGGLLQSGTAAAKEWENQTMKELLLSPASRAAIMTGKMLGAFLISLGSSVIVLVVLILIVGVRPENWGEVLGFTLLSLVIFDTVGTLLGTVIKVRRPVIALSMGTALPVFFLSGAFALISFTTPLLQVIAQVFPVYYQNVVLQHAFHGFALNTYGLWGNTLILVGYALLLILLVTVALQRSTVSH
jgi:ABC-type transport system involved in multi-copper enzyme maturation permease subunit